MKTLVLSAFLAVLGASALAQSGTIRGDFAGCLTENALDEFLSAANRQDMRQIEALLNRQCFNLRGRQYSIVSRGFGTSRIRVYAGGDSVLLWTVSEALR